MTNNTTKATSVMVRVFNKRGIQASRNDVTIAEVTTATHKGKTDEYIKIIKGNLYARIYSKHLNFTYFTEDNKLLIQDDLFSIGGVK